MSKNDSGPAFPIPGLQDDSDFNGMTLRDYFAAKTMQGIWACVAENEDYPNREKVAAMAYAQADAMLAARKA